MAWNDYLTSCRYQNADWRLRPLPREMLRYMCNLITAQLIGTFPSTGYTWFTGIIVLIAQKTKQCLLFWRYNLMLNPFLVNAFLFKNVILVPTRPCQNLT